MLAARIVANAAALDAYLSGLLVSFMGSKAKPTFAMFEAIHQTAKTQALRAAAKTMLTQDDHDMFLALLALAKSADKHRNRFAHWLWAYSEDIDDGLLLIDPAANFEVLVSANANLEEGRRIVTNSLVELDRKRVLVYSLADLSAVVTDYTTLRDWFIAFNQHIHPHLERDEWLYRSMLAAPAFREALARVRPPAQKPDPKGLLGKSRKPKKAS